MTIMIKRKQGRIKLLECILPSQVQLMT